MKLLYKSILTSLIAGSTFFAGAQNSKTAKEPYFRDWKISGKVTNDKIVYSAGEPVEFVFEVRDAKGKYVKTDYLQLVTKKDGDPQKTELFPMAGNNPFKRTLTLGKPGQIELNVKVCADIPGKGHKASLYRRNEKGSKEDLQFGSGVLFDFKEIKPGVPEPEDFDAFWKAQIEADKALPFKVIEKRLVATTKENVRIYSLILNAPVGNVHAEMSIPAKAEDDPSVKLPIWVLGQAYGIASAKTWPWPGMITITVNSHDIDNYGTREYYRDLGKNKLRNYAFDKKTNSDPKTAYFHGMIMRDYRAVRYLTTLPQWNGKIRFYGHSQGGFRSVVLGGLFPETVSVKAGVPWSNDLGGVLAGRSPRWRPEYTPALRYFDPCYHAKRIRNAEVVIAAGMIDTACQAAGITALFNNLPDSTPFKKLILYQHVGHSIPWTPKGFRYEYTVRNGKEAGKLIPAEAGTR